MTDLCFELGLSGRCLFTTDAAQLRTDGYHASAAATQQRGAQQANVSLGDRAAELATPANRMSSSQRWWGSSNVAPRHPCTR